MGNFSTSLSILPVVTVVLFGVPPTENPYIPRDETRSSIKSRYADVAFVMSNTVMESRMRCEVQVRLCVH
ncbi:hypothetical protein ABH944_006264 [Caballeronia udeis]|uniref:Secreted protein n=1 Tax=Caballeronia udeis TaxID=1232866 RepID=A0ABW8MQU6_9BURK